MVLRGFFRWLGWGIWSRKVFELGGRRWGLVFYFLLGVIFVRREVKTVCVEVV